MGSELSEIVEKIKDADKFIKDRGRDALKASFDSFFKKYPEVDSIRWVQFTPYFNDGEPCVFHVHTPELRLVSGTHTESVCAMLTEYGDASNYEIDKNDVSYEYGEHCHTRIFIHPDRPYYVKPTSREEALVAEYNMLVSAAHIVPRLFEFALGDHVMVVADRDGFHVTEFDHD